MIKEFIVALFSLIVAWFGGKDDQRAVIESIASPTAEVIPTIIGRPANIPTIRQNISVSPTVKNDSQQGEWGVASQVDEHTWTMKVGMDEAMATPPEVFEVLNEYRRQYGAAVLMWDDKLADYAKTRAVYFNQIKNLDGHKGLADFLENENGFEVLGFSSVGENASYGYKMSGTHLIEWIYGADKDHDDNQKNTKWAYVGIGVEGTSNCVIFATGKR